MERDSVGCSTQTGDGFDTLGFSMSFGSMSAPDKTLEHVDPFGETSSQWEQDPLGHGRERISEDRSGGQLATSQAAPRIITANRWNRRSDHGDRSSNTREAGGRQDAGDSHLLIVGI